MEGVEEGGDRGRWADRHSPQGELGGAGRLPLEVERGRREGGRQRHWVWFGIRGEGLANHHPVEEEEEEEGVGSLTEMRRVDWLKAVTEWFLYTQFVLIIQSFIRYTECFNKFTAKKTIKVEHKTTGRIWPGEKYVMTFSCSTDGILTLHVY